MAKEDVNSPRYRLTKRLLAKTPDEFIVEYNAGKYDDREDIASLISTLLKWYPDLTSEK